ncbi:Zn-ribbon domain-containing OB-fold protein [Oricola sp.]|uniref:Zn-ribbon domain-containing OB-fold protein n=1 Tax=Oricola sp. TaxID=1979950 RepID=UPI0025ED4B6E|nr:Zn-ribbon domain-containing OB-fold protein [Oricola sp.]MCI5074193.1 Zn-ribbon domain-containing OB-fold protein [Oricola sp.]
MDGAYEGKLPRPTPETLPFWQGAKAGKLMLPWCEDCGQPHFYPRAICPHCLSDRLDWRQASGRGKLHTYVINHRAAKGFTAPYVIAVVELAEGPRMLSNVVTEGEPTPDMLTIDMDLEVTFDPVTDDITLPRFRPAP